MCGIAGIISSEKTLNINCLKKLNDGIAHRGPDDEGYFVKDNEKCYSLKGNSSPIDLEISNLNQFTDLNIKFGFCHRRFSIIDTTKLGHQPMVDENSNIAISFNGEIYNYLEIRRELEDLEEKSFRTNTDTEVILKAYKKWGTDCFEKFNGFWAIAIFDEDKLILSRDRIGKKPLYYTDDEGYFIFCSEIKPILELRKSLKISTTINKKAAFDYIALDRRNTNFDSLYSEIKQIEPSTYYSIDVNCIKNISKKTYWSLQNVQKQSNDLSTFSSMFMERLDESIKLRLRADVPLEANLSGGLDSAAIVALASKNLKQDNQNLTTHTFRYVGDKTLDETKSAHQIASFCETNFKIIDIEQQDILDDIDNLVSKSEEPVHSMAALVQSFAWEKIANEGFKVILHGSANDELMIGYDYLKKIEIMNRLKNGHLSNLARDLIFQPINFLKLTKWLVSEDVDLMDYSNYFSKGINEVNKNRFISHKDKIKELNKSTKNRMYEDLINLRVPYWCNLMDKNMMSVPIEVRMPYLDYKFLEFIFSVPSKFLLRNGFSKFLLRYSLRDMLPNKILWNRKKIGFSSPNKTWRKKGEKKLLQELNDPKLDEFLNTTNIKNNISKLDENFLWRLINFSVWHRLNK